jgi:zinc protease
MDYVVSGVHVIQRLTRATDVVAVDLYLEGGVQQVTASTAGVEELAVRASEYGTLHYPGRSSRQALARTGSEWVVEAETDWTMVGFRGVTDQFDSTWAVFADRITSPTLDSGAVALVRDRMTREVRLHGLTPDGVAHHLADSLAFEGHPYALDPGGTEGSLAELTPDVVRRYVRDNYMTSRCLLVVVGNIPRSRLEPLIASTVGTLPPGSYVWAPPVDVPRRPTSIMLVPRVTATNYILGYFAGPSVKSPDYPAFDIATHMLSARLQYAIRYKTSLSYAAFAPYSDRAIATGGLYASTTSPALVMGLMHLQLEWVKHARYHGYELDKLEKEFATSIIVQNETNAAQAGTLARAQLFEGDYRKASAALAILRRVSPDDVIRVAKLYMRDIQFVYVGDTTRVRREWANSM